MRHGKQGAATARWTFERILWCRHVSRPDHVKLSFRQCPILVTCDVHNFPTQMTRSLDGRRVIMTRNLMVGVFCNLANIWNHCRRQEMCNHSKNLPQHIWHNYTLRAHHLLRGIHCFWCCVGNSFNYWELMCDSLNSSRSLILWLKSWRMIPCGFQCLLRKLFKYNIGSFSRGYWWWLDDFMKTRITFKIILDTRGE